MVTPRPDLIREIAHDAGFDLVRFGPADVGEDGPRFLDWLEAGRAAGMDYLRKNAARIADPQQYVEGARSTIALAQDYGRAPLSTADGAGRIARYAGGRDYHRSLGNAARKLRTRLEADGLLKGATRYGTDAVPVLERALASRAGIGFLAKSAGVISPQLGPYLLLSELVTTTELPFDAPSPGTCGTCTRCLDACPTEAIVAPHQVDARRCLSYTTIEHRGFIEPELRAAQGDWLFGCDVCLEVCPFANRGRASQPTPDTKLTPDLATHRAIERYALIDVLELGPEAYDRDWTGTAMRRATRTGLRRNAAIVLGNQQQESALPALRRCLEDPDPVVRGHAVWAIRRIQPREPALALAERRESDPRVRQEFGSPSA